jgi:hypothetical protein
LGSKNLQGLDLTLLCIDLRDYLEIQHGLSIQGEWTFHEMELFELALGDMVQGFGGTAKFTGFFAGTDVVRYREAGRWEVSWPLHEVKIRDTPFAVGDDFVRWLFIHEFGHRFDVIYLLEASISLENFTGGNTTGFLCNRLIEVTGICQYTFGGDTVSDKATTDRREDWAESFAAAMFQGSWPALVANNNHGIKADALTVAAVRITCVRNFIATGSCVVVPPTPTIPSGPATPPPDFCPPGTPFPPVINSTPRSAVTPSPP